MVMPKHVFCALMNALEMHCHLKIFTLRAKIPILELHFVGVIIHKCMQTLTSPYIWPFTAQLNCKHRGLVVSCYTIIIF